MTTGGIEAIQGDRVIRQSVQTDLDLFWDYYQQTVLPQLAHAILRATNRNPRAVDQPLFDRMEVEVNVSGTDESLGIREEWNSAAEALHEDIYFVTLDFVEALGQEPTANA